MLHIFALIALAAYFLLPSPDILNVSFAALTLSMLGQAFMHAIAMVAALVLTFKSLAQDKIWPWNWTKQFLAYWIFTVAVSVGAFYVLATVQYSKLDLPWSPLVCFGISFVVYAVMLFNSDDR